MSLIQRAIAGQLDDFRKELASGVDVNQQDKDGRTPLMHAILRKNLPMVSLILEAGGNPNTQDKNGYGALHFAAQEYVHEIVTMLVSHGAVVDLEDMHGNTPLLRAVFMSQGRGDVIKILLRAGANKDHQNKHGMSPTILAKSIANYEVAKFLE